MNIVIYELFQNGFFSILLKMITYCFVILHIIQPLLKNIRPQNTIPYFLEEKKKQISVLLQITPYFFFKFSNIPALKIL